MDTAVLERMVKIMSYMRGTGSKPGKLRKKDKLRMLQARRSPFLTALVIFPQKLNDILPKGFA